MAETRRSSRIAAQPKTQEPAPKPARKPSKKRSQDEGGSAPAAKKAKAEAKEVSSEAAADETKPAQEGDAAETAEAIAEEAEDKDDGVKPIDIGDSLPELTLKNEKGEDVEIAKLTAEKGVVLFLVPKADTPGCTTQACGFRDSYPDFTSTGFDVYCLSADSSTAQAKWQTKKELPYPMLSDPKRVLITALGAGEGGKTKRSHFIFEKGGKLIDKKNPVKPADSPRLALEFIKSLSN